MRNINVKDEHIIVEPIVEKEGILDTDAIGSKITQEGIIYDSKTSGYQKGDILLYKRHMGYDFEFDGKKYKLLSKSEWVGIITQQ